MSYPEIEQKKRDVKIPEMDDDFDEEFLKSEFIREFKQHIQKFKTGINRCSSELKCVKNNLKSSKEVSLSKSSENSRSSKEVVIHIKEYENEMEQ